MKQFIRTEVFKMTLGAFMIIKNGIKLGYPFVESIVSILPYVEEMTIVDGMSTDGTFEFLRKMREKNRKIKCFQTAWGESKTGSVMKNQTDLAKNICSKDWLIYVQADEVWHPESAKNLKIYPKRYPKMLGFSFPFAHLSFLKWIDYNPAYSNAIRLIRNLPEITSEHDAWTFTIPRAQVKEISLKFPIYHTGSASPYNALQKNINHAKLYPDLPDYQENAKKSKLLLEKESYEIKKPDSEYWKENPFPLPEILKPLVGCKEYKPREELFLLLDK